MASYPGLPEGEIRQISLPEPFFSELLPLIDHLGELKLTLHIFWQLAQREGRIGYLRRVDLETNERLIGNLKTAKSNLDEALDAAIRRRSILEAQVEEHVLYFLNSPQGRAAVHAIKEGKWRPTGEEHTPVETLPERPNIFQLYEENIGPLTPLIAEALGEAEDSYHPVWIQDAIRIAVERNKRSWRYVDAILRRWEREGRDVREEQKDQREPEEVRRRYIEGEFSDFVEH
ncbi:DnaD domain-containing protein [Chloroflexota bacterium]